MNGAVEEVRRGTESVRYRAYSEHRDSGVKWLGEIPAHWEARRLKHLARLNPESLREDADPELDITYIDIGSVDSLGVIDGRQQLRFASAPTRARRMVRDGDVIVSTVRTYLRAIAPIRDPEAGTIVSTGFAVVRPDRDLIPDYAAYVLRAPFFVERVVANSTGVSFPAINESEIATFELPVPPASDQRAIAAFLDRETAKIDGLVAKKERLIELLQEKRTALIKHAVTKGLDSDAPMNDSGVEWLGEIPAHWEVARIKSVARMESGHTPDKKVDSYWRDGDVPWVSLADTLQLRSADRISDTAVRATNAGIAHSSARVLPAGTVVFSRDATIGLCAVLEVPMAVSQHFIGWVCGSAVHPEYLLFVLRSMNQELERLTMGATVRTIGMPDVSELVTPLPPVDDQKEIVLYLLTARSQIDDLLSRVRDALDRLKERRTALISAAVTGGIDVREEVAR